MNKLQNESSLYLKQHANNPVNWYPWGEDAFVVARQESKLILVSIGYSSCHWCHVMEKESFEDEEVAEYMNLNFVSIKVDREEYPDVDKYYMYALQSMTGQGGWPLNIFLTPDGQPFYGGTYFPPIPAHGRPSWLQTLMALQSSWEKSDPEIRDSASKYQNFVLELQDNFKSLGSDELSIQGEEVLTFLKSKIDKAEGGFSQAPKFPMLMTLDWMLDLALRNEDEEALNLVKNNLQKILLGGIYDQVQGGLMRYSTDSIWLVPHFEKMLYTQAQIIPILARCKSLYSSEEIWDYYLDLTLDFIENWMQDEDGGYCSAIDADTTEGEGYYYTFSYSEVQEVADEESIVNLFGAKPQGNFHSRNIIHFQEVPPFSEITPSLKELAQLQNDRVKPMVDTKKICAWNAYLGVAMARSFIYTGNMYYYEKFKKLCEYSIEKYGSQNNSIHRLVYENGEQIDAVAEDYAMMALMMIYHFRFTQEEASIKMVKEWVTVIETKYAKDGLFSQSSIERQGIPQVNLGLMDDMLPDVNGVMYEIYYVLSLIDMDVDMKKKADELNRKISPDINQNPAYRGYMGRVLTAANTWLKMETNMSWSDMPSSLPENIWLVKKLAVKGEEVYIQICDSEKCYQQVEGLKNCKEFLDGIDESFENSRI